MSGYTIVKLQSFYDIAEAAYEKAMKQASVQLNGRGMTHQKLLELEATMNRWKSLLDQANGESNGIEIVRVVSKHG